MLKKPLILEIVLKSIKKENYAKMSEFIKNALERNYISFEQEKELLSFFYNYLETFFSKVTCEEMQRIYDYTGTDYKYLNSFLRQTWDSRENGILTDKEWNYWEEYSDKFKATFLKIPNSLPENIKVYRGTSISNFRGYGIKSIVELKGLIGEYLYDSAFTSTSLMREKSFFKKAFDYHNYCNIEIEYLIPKECDEGLPLLYKDMGYIEGQCEFLIGMDNLSKIIDVEISHDENYAHIRALLIPKKVWYFRYQREKDEINENKKSYLK